MRARGAGALWEAGFCALARGIFVNYKKIRPFCTEKKAERESGARGAGSEECSEARITPGA